jgi:hypothetical protein
VISPWRGILLNSSRKSSQLLQGRNRSLVVLTGVQTWCPEPTRFPCIALGSAICNERLYEMILNYFQLWHFYSLS